MNGRDTMNSLRAFHAYSEGRACLIDCHHEDCPRAEMEKMAPGWAKKVRAGDVLAPAEVIRLMRYRRILPEYWDEAGYVSGKGPLP